MNIRKGAICDLTSIIDIEKAVYNKPYWNVAMIKNLFIDSIFETIWVIENGKKIIGFLIEQRCDNEINLLNVAIDKPFQNRGIGKILINQIEQDLSIVQFRNQVAYLPQEIFLINDSIAANITLSEKITDTEYQKLIESTKQAKIFEFINT